MTIGGGTRIYDWARMTLQVTEFRIRDRKQEGPRRSWAIILFLMTVFFLAHHDLFRLHSYEVEPSAKAEAIAEATDEGSTVRRIALLSLGLLGLITLWSKGGTEIRINGVLGWLILFFFFWSFLSITWADNIELTFRRMVVLLMLSLGALAAARRFSDTAILYLAFVSSFLFLLIGISAELAFGTLNPWLPNYRFAGTLHPNHQGWNCATLLLASIALARTAVHRPFLYRIAAFVAVVFLVLTKSRTAFAGALLALVVYCILYLPKSKVFLYASAAISTACLFFLTLGHNFLSFASFAILLGRSDLSATQTLSGRIPLWTQLLPYIWERPFLGYGFGGFWTSDRVIDISGQVGWGVPGAHNGFIDIILGIGILGVACYMGILLVALKRLITLYNADHNPTIVFGVMMLVFFSLVMLIEEIAWETSMPTYIVLTFVAQLGLTGPKTKTSLRAKPSR